MASEQQVPTQDRLAEGKNPRGIPKAPFIADIEQFLGGPDVPVEGALRNFQDALAKYRFMEQNLNQRKQSLSEKVPDISKTLATVEFLRDQKETEEGREDDLTGDDNKKPTPLRTTFELNDTLYAEAELADTDKVYLWLGANVMLSYTLPAAISLLKSKLAVAQTNLNTTIEDLEFLREQMTILEVNTARVYNWDIKRRRERKERALEVGKVPEAKG